MVIRVLLPNYENKTKKVERTGLDWIVDTPLTAMITRDAERRATMMGWTILKLISNSLNTISKCTFSDGCF